MVPERVLAAVAVGVVLISALAAGAIPAAIDPPEENVRPSVVHIEGVSIAAGEVTGGSATLGVEAMLSHRGGPAENVSVEFRAVDLASGLLETTERVSVGRITGDREVSIPGNLTVPRQGGYRIETVLYVDGERRAEAVKAVRGVGSLQPPYARSTVAFHRFVETGQPTIEYAIAEAGENRTTLAVSTYLTNEGDEPVGDLRLVLTARQAESNIVAARTTVALDQIQPGRTVTPEAELTVPSNYNYYLDAQLWSDDVIVGTARSAANLDPTETISVNETRREVGLEVSDFERPEGRPTEPASHAWEAPASHAWEAPDAGASHA